MYALLRNTALILCIWLMLAGVSLGKQVYLRDGGIIDCESFWRRGNMVMVKINRDTVVEFEQNEIEVRRTLPRIKSISSAENILPALFCPPVRQRRLAKLLPFLSLPRLRNPG